MSEHNQIVPRELLFDTVFDPEETRNLVNDPAYASSLKEMRAGLIPGCSEPTIRCCGVRGKYQWGAVVNDPNAISPQEAVRGLVMKPVN